MADKAEETTMDTTEEVKEVKSTDADADALDEDEIALMEEDAGEEEMSELKRIEEENKKAAADASSQQESQDEGSSQAGDDDDDESSQADSQAGASSSKAKTPASPEVGSKAAGRLAKKVAKEEERENKRAKKDHEAKLKLIRQEQNAAMSVSGNITADARLAFIQKQAEVFSRFITGGSIDTVTVSGEVKGKKKKKGAGGRGPGRKSEEQEDAELMAEASRGARRTRLTVQPSCIKFGQMRDYQIEGLNWMIGLYEQGINGILADEMGLGKTLQSISLLGYLTFDRLVCGPHIVVVPKSTLGNWMNEFKRWCPSLRAISVHGPKAERQQRIKENLVAGQFDVVVTTFEVLIIERAQFLKFKWRYLMIDEAHRIKNEKSRLALVVRELHAEFRLLITGTPLQNNLHELWALLNFLLPEVFSSADDFEDYFQIDAMENDAVVGRLHSILRPFLLRRLKADVAQDLPPKREIKLFTGLTEMQTFWYKKMLSKDVMALNQLGGPEKTRLMNILMQLRKVTNHPYLFQGAEIGPPYFDGPHLWENAGKMILLHKLLIKLKQKGDRVLIFSQMTRLLDILEDYMRAEGYKYARIDGNTKGEDRDSAIADYNAPDSDKFVFLLSTRAGGLGINLATANIVILYDSDWNPQMDLQAQDRAHRIGQKKQVMVFRFVTEGTVEEKIVERAEKKLYLDAVVVQQGRLQQSNSKLGKDELMSMVKFGAEAVFSSNGATITDEDIDLILEKGEKRTDEKASKLKHDVQHNLANFSLAEQDTSTFMFEGKDYSSKNKSANFISIGQRSRKKTNYNDSYNASEVFGAGAGETTKKREPRLPKGLTMHDFQFFDRPAVQKLEKKEHELIMQKRTQLQLIKELRMRERRQRQSNHGDEAAEHASEADKLEKELENFELTDKERGEKETLVQQGFGTWSRGDFRAYTLACEQYGRSDMTAIVNDVVEATGKTKTEVREYHKAFWSRYKELTDWEKIIDRIGKGEQKLARREAITKALNDKVARTPNPWQTLTIAYGSNKGKAFTEEEDRFLVCMMQELGYGAWEQLKQEIRKTWLFRFDWFIKSRTPAELQRRCDTLVRLIEKENDELGGGKKRKKDEGSAATGRGKKKK